MVKEKSLIDKIVHVSINFVKIILNFDGFEEALLELSSRIQGKNFE